VKIMKRILTPAEPRHEVRVKDGDYMPSVPAMGTWRAARRRMSAAGAETLTLTEDFAACPDHSQLAVAASPAASDGQAVLV